MKALFNSEGIMKISLKEDHPAWEAFQVFLKNLPEATKEQLETSGLSNSLWLGYKEGWEDAVNFMEDKLIRWTADD